MKIVSYLDYFNFNCVVAVEVLYDTLQIISIILNLVLLLTSKFQYLDITTKTTGSSGARAVCPSVLPAVLVIGFLQLFLVAQIINCNDTNAFSLRTEQRLK